MAALVALFLGACAPSVVPTPNAADAHRASARWPGTDVAQLHAGRSLYVRKCSGCHSLVAPTVLPPQQWPSTVATMAARITSLGEADRELITRYLVTMSDLAGPGAASLARPTPSARQP